MRLISISVRNYRVLRDVRVDLDPSLTVVGAPNETGKSTLIEAAHRALFLRARATGKLREAMLPQGRAEHPEVGVSFVAGGKSWHLVKKFAGASGQCTLTEAGGSTWYGDEAEDRLAGVLGVAASTGKIAAAALVEQWAHLWVWQGASGVDPTDKANDQKGALLSRLDQTEGTAAAVMQSALDSSLASRFQLQHDEQFKKNGDPRADSAFGRAEAERAQAAEVVAVARARCDALERSAAAFAAAREALERVAADEAVVGPQALQTETVLARVAALRAVEASLAMDSSAARLNCNRWQEAEAQITAFARESLALAEALAPEEAASEALAREEALCLARLEAAEGNRLAAVAARAAAQQAHDMEAARLNALEKAAESARWQDRCRIVESLQAEVRRVVLDLAALPVVEPALLKALMVLEKSRDEAAATLRGMAAGVRVEAADLPVFLDGTALGAGQERVLTSPADLIIGGGVHLRLTPGGGAGLADASRRQAETEESIRTRLGELGLPSVAAAAEILDRRRQLDSERTALRKRLADFGADTLPAQAAAAIEATAAAEATLARLQIAAGADPAGDGPLEDAAIAQARCQLASQSLAALRAREEAAATARTEAGHALSRVRARRTEHSVALAGRRTELDRARARHEYLVAAHGDAASRQAALAEASAACTAADAALATARSELAALQPESREADRERLRRAVEEIGRRRREAETALAIARSELTRDGGDDPHALLAQAVARELAATESAARARRDAEAVRLLHRLFAEEQRALAVRLTQPLAEKINAYLQSLFGPGASAVLTFEDQVFGSFALVRPDQLSGAVPFAALSGGTREQVAAAMRLAMAEVLAAGHDGCLPLVFDDAFAYSDPDRVQSLQRMLDLAARRGLQLIVLTCSPGDYAGLGARVVALEKGA